MPIINKSINKVLVYLQKLCRLAYCIQQFLRIVKSFFSHKFHLPCLKFRSSSCFRSLFKALFFCTYTLFVLIPSSSAISAGVISSTMFSVITILSFLCSFNISSAKIWLSILFFIIRITNLSNIFLDSFRISFSLKWIGVSMGSVRLHQSAIRPLRSMGIGTTSFSC